MMKIFLSIALLCCGLTAQLHAVDVENGYSQMLAEGKVWNYTHHTSDGDRSFRVEVKGDTVIGNVTCHKVYVCTADSRQLYGCYYEDNNCCIHAYLASDFQKKDGKWGLYELPSGTPEKTLYAFMPPGASMANYTLTSSAFETMGLAASERAAAQQSGNYYGHSQVYPTRYDLIETDKGIWCRVQMTDFLQKTVAETWVSGIGDIRWGILQPHHEAEQAGDESIEFESCYQDGRCLFTKDDFKAAALTTDYRPFVEDGKSWTCSTNSEGADIYYFRLQRDTVIDNKTCKKLYSQNRLNDGKTYYEGALYEEGYRVYRYAPSSNTAVLLYDFSLEAGEHSAPIVEWMQGTDRQVKTYIEMAAHACELRDGKLCRMVVFFMVDDYGERQSVQPRPGVWIEGVGPGRMLDVTNNLDFYVTGGRYGEGIIDCSVGGVSIYRSSQYDRLVSSLNHPQSTRTADNNIYDLQGRPLAVPPAKGVYIQDGRKVLK